jgi:two-component system KDP operon response regulator KdpE
VTANSPNSVSVSIRLGYTLTGEVKASEIQQTNIICQQTHKMLTHKFLLGELWDKLTVAPLLRVYVGLLSQKVEIDPARPRYIITKIGVGYRLRMTK